MLPRVAYRVRREGRCEIAIEAIKPLVLNVDSIEGSSEGCVDSAGASLAHCFTAFRWVPRSQ